MSSLIDRIKAADNIDVLTRVEVTAVCGHGHLERVDLRHVDTDQPESRDLSALFVFIGVAPRTTVFKDLLATDDHGFILTGAAASLALAAVPLSYRPFIYFQF